MFGAKKINLSDNHELILRKKTTEGNNTYVVKPHKSGDLNSYEFEEVKTEFCNGKSILCKTGNTKKEMPRDIVKIANQKTLYKMNNYNSNAQKNQLNQSIKPNQPNQPKQQIKTVNLIQKQPLQLIEQPVQKYQMSATIKPMNRPKIQPSNLNVIRRGLLIGIDYIGTNNKQNECINDCEKLRNFLITNKYFNSNELTIMTDFTSGTLNPSKRNIMNQLDLLLKFARSNPKKQILLFVSYSGIGHTVCNVVNDQNQTNKNDKLAVLCPADFQQSGFIGDEELRNKFINQLPSNVKLILVIDACHNETMLGLKYKYKIDEKNTYTVLGKLLPTVCDVIVISGCKDNNQYDYKGAIIDALLFNYKEINNYNELLTNMKKWLKDNEYTQIPQLTSGKLIDIDNKFLLSSFR